MNSIAVRLAWRNLWRHKRRTWLTVAAMIFSNCLLIFSISLQFGSYDMMINNTLQAFSGHAQIQHAQYLDDPKIRYTVSDISKQAATLRHALQSEAIAARAMGFALASSKERSYGIQIIGVEPAFEPNVSTIPGLIKQGRYLNDDSRDEIVIGSVLARNLKIQLGDELTFLGSAFDGSFAAAVVNVIGIYETGMPELDRSMAHMQLDYFQEIFTLGKQGHSIVINAPHLDTIDKRVTKASVILNDDTLSFLNWDQLQPGLKQAIQADMTSAWFMYIVLVVLVAFSVLNTQLMSVLERTREFGTMMALGVKPNILSRLVITETVMMTCLGLVLGVLLGAIITYYFSVAGFYYPGMEEMVDKFNLPGRMYPSVSFLSLLLGPCIVGIGSVIAAIYPALRLNWIRPIEAMRAI